MLRADISVDALRAAVERHHFHVQGVRYGCALKWAALERDCDPQTARVLLSVELTASPAGSAPASNLHLLVQLGSLAELTPILNEALCDYLAQQVVSEAAEGGTSSSWRVPFPLDGARPN